MAEHRLLGAALILAASGWTGFWAALLLKRTERQMDELICALEQMACEIGCRRTAFAELCQTLAQGGTGETAAFFRCAGSLCAAHEQPACGIAAEACRSAGLRLPDDARRTLSRLIDGFGAYDAEAQLRQIAAAETELRRCRARLREQNENRCRSCRVTGLCAGAALAILVM